jgi:glycosyltransferase involved in cell wall biosynthesis
LDEYSRAAVVVLSSVRENAPMAVIEAMASARPVVATRVGGVPDIVIDGETGFLVPPGDHSDLAACISAVLENPVRSRQMGRLGREVAGRRFSALPIARQYWNLYREVLSESDGRDLAEAP